MVRSISILVFFLPLIFLLSIQILGAPVITPLIEKVCSYSNNISFCRYVFGTDPLGPIAKTKFNFEAIAVRTARANYTNIHGKIWTITANETNPKFRPVYRKCLQEYNLMKKGFVNLTLTLGYGGNLDQSASDIGVHAMNCVLNLRDNPDVPNPIGQDNHDLISFVDLIRALYYAPLS